MRISSFPSQEPIGAYTEFAAIAELSNGSEKVIGEWQGSQNAEAAGAAALSAWHLYHGTAHVQIFVDGTPWAYVAVRPLTHEKAPFLCPSGFCWHSKCGQISPEECYCRR